MNYINAAQHLAEYRSTTPRPHWDDDFDATLAALTFDDPELAVSTFRYLKTLVGENADRAARLRAKADEFKRSLA